MEKENIKYHNLAAILNEDLVTVRGTFEKETADKIYTYKCHKDIATTLGVGDFLIVEGMHHGFSVMRVTAIDDELDINPESDIFYKWAVGKADLAFYQSLKAAEEKQVEHLQKQRRRAVRHAYIQSLGLEEALNAKCIEGDK